MSPHPLEIHPRAIAEARAARRWYARRSVAVAQRFVAELDHALTQITAVPRSWPPYLHGTRFYRVRRFPYLVIYNESPAAVHVLAVAHGGQRPGYWRRRLP